MARTLRRPSATGFHHVMNRGDAHQAIFHSVADRLEFGRLLAEIHALFGVKVVAYCLMGNHFHLVVWAPPGALSKAMKHLEGVFTQRSNARRGRDGHVFRGRFRSNPIEDEAYLLWVVRYVHLNPLDLPGVTAAGEYRWSSLRTYLGLRPVPDFVDTSTVLALLGGVDELVRFTGSDVGPPVTDPSVLLSLVELALVIHEDDDACEERQRRQRTRTLLNLVAATVVDPDVRGMAESLLGPRSNDAVRLARRRAEDSLRTRPATAKALAWLTAQLDGPTSGVRPQTSGTTFGV